MILKEGKNNRIYLNQVYTKYEEEDLNQESKKMTLKILNCFTNHEKQLLNYLIIILQLYLRRNIKHGKKVKNTEKN